MLNIVIYTNNFPYRAKATSWLLEDSTVALWGLDSASDLFFIYWELATYLKFRFLAHFKYSIVPAIVYYGNPRNISKVNAEVKLHSPGSENLIHIFLAMFISAVLQDFSSLYL